MNSRTEPIIPDQIRRLLAHPSMKWIITPMLFLALVLFYVLWQYNTISLADMLGLYSAALSTYVGILALLIMAVPSIYIPPMESSVMGADVVPIHSKKKHSFVPTWNSYDRKSILDFLPMVHFI